MILIFSVSVGNGLPSGNKLYIGSIYHPHTTNMKSLTEIKKNLEKAASFDKQTVWVGTFLGAWCSLSGVVASA
jgi:hypothetical protein